ncbi:MAG TPA: serine/threonine-protein kinase [Terriglobia bacterium]|nr:serine/threonine-protein kinase [Terriglobia bacterium]
MTPERWVQVEELFHRAAECEPQERIRLLEEAGSTDPELRREVESLLSWQESADGHLQAAVDGEADCSSFLESPPWVGSPAFEGTADEFGASESGPGAVFGQYHLLHKAGEGGMGEVWLAEQKEPVRRRVALKLVKGGMYTREVRARFESERQALALMDHPAIAKVFDAGSTPQGAPYFVMEYVAGVPITTYCDNHRLSTGERLELFVHVCEGVQHAHQKAIIHRDLKPSNILVTEVDGHPAPKIIDFGVAKALAQKLTEHTMYTRVGTLVGTPEYMSPEQALSSGEDIDTRTDVYSLGVIFYELLAGVPPLELRKASLDEFLRRLREEEPPTPSTKIRTQNPAASTEVARKRQTEPPALLKQIRGDLDSIALKALEKDRSRRYSSPSDFAADIVRCLRNEAVVAVPASATYRARKFARRHRAALVTACGVAGVLIAAAAVSIRQSIRADREVAVAQAVNDFLQNDLLAQASASTQSGPSVKSDPHLEVRTALDRAAARIGGKFDRQPEVEAAVRDTMGQTYLDLGLYPEARKQTELALDLERRALGAENPKTLNTMSRLGRIAYLQGRYREAEELVSGNLASQHRVLGSEHPDTLNSMNLLGLIYLVEVKYPQAEALFSESLNTRRRRLGSEHPDTLNSMNNLALIYEDQGKYPQADALFSQTVEIRSRVLGPEHPETLRSMNNLATVYTEEGKYPQADALFSQILEIRRHVLGPEHPSTLDSMRLLALNYTMSGRYAAAKALYGQVLEMSRRVLGPEHPATLYTGLAFAWMYQRAGKYALAEAYAAQAVAGYRHALGPDDPTTMNAAADLALAYLSQGKFAQCELLAREAVQADQKDRPDDWQRFRAESLLGASLARENKYAEAEPLLLGGYQGMLVRKDRIPVPYRYHLDMAHRWVVQLYRAWGRPEKAAEWKKK